MNKIINLVSLTVTVILNGVIPNNSSNSIGDIFKDKKLSTQPNSWAFSIWGIIYTALFINLLNSDWDTPSTVFFVISCVFNVLWIKFWLDKQIIISNICLAIISGCLYLLWKRNVGNNIFLQNSVAIYLSWTIGANLLNLGYVLQEKKLLSSDNINILLTTLFSLLQIIWQFNKKQELKDSISVPLVGLWTSIAIISKNNSKSKLYGTIYLITTIVATLNQVRKLI